METKLTCALVIGRGAVFNWCILVVLDPGFAVLRNVSIHHIARGGMEPPVQPWTLAHATTCQTHYPNR